MISAKRIARSNANLMIAIALKEGADRERMRIRRAQKHARDWLRNMAAHHECGADRYQAQRFLSQLDSATRGKGRK